MTYRANQLTIIIIFAMLSQALFFNHALAQNSSTTIDAKQQKVIIEEFSNTLLTHYVVLEHAEKLIEALHQAQKRGEYSTTKTIDDFLAQANKLIQNITHDKHLALLSPKKFNQVMKMFYSDSHHENKNQRHSKEDSPLAKNNHHKGHHSLKTKSSNNPLSIVGVSSVSEISRDGLNQTGYLALERFDASTRSIDFIKRVFGTFTESDNIIIDLRNCGGGDAEMVKILSGYFFDKPTHLLNTSMPDKNNIKRIVERWTVPNALSAYFSDKPLKILISSKSFSAAESFAFGMQASGRALLVGETTGGSGYINDFFSLPNNLGASISVGRTYDFRTGKGWQNIGVIPDVQVSQEHALDTALTDFTKQSGKLARIKGENKRIYQTIQNFTNAWYGAFPELMKGLVSNEFTRRYLDHKGNTLESITAEKLIVNTAKGDGTRKNKIYYNRIIRDINISKNQATAVLILRETTHHLKLIKEEGEWLIIQDDYKDKYRS